MRSDYIVPEPSGRRRVVTLPRLIGAASVFGLGLLLAGHFGPPAPSASNDPASAGDIRLLSAEFAAAPQPPADAPSLLGDLAPIGRAEARAAAPASPALPPALPALDDPAMDMPGTEAPAAELAGTAPPAEPSFTQQRVTVAYGDSLSALFDRHKLKSADWIALSRLDGEAARLRSLRPGDELRLALDDERRVMRLSLRLDELNTLEIQRTTAGHFEHAVHTDPTETRNIMAEGTIENSLFLSAKDAGLSDRLTMELTDIFAWDVDFVLDIRGGDSFRLVYEEVLRDGARIKDGNILAAEFVNRGRVIQAVRYTDSDGQTAYYSPEGLPMKKAFLRSPVDFTRISSRFSLGRKHPILNRIRAHRGVDYAAPSGTPIKSAGSGKVIFAGRKGGYGNVVIVQHAGKYKTLYAHMKNFRRGIRRGASVSQGQTLGYVGMSGLATGPHLHYEFLIHDRHVNPLTVDLPSAPRIADSELARFKAETASLLAQLQPPAGTEVADAR